MIRQARYLRYVFYADIPDHLAMGWLALIPDGAYYGSAYGIEMAWICDCRWPGAQREIPLHRHGLGGDRAMERGKPEASAAGAPDVLQPLL
jgi:hypothetical protein